MELISACAAGDRSAQKRLYTLLVPYLNAICKRYLQDTSHAQDVLQESFIRIFTNLRQYDAALSNFKTWSARITINCCLKQNGKTLRNTTIDLASAPVELAIPPEVIKLLSDEDMLLILRKMPEQFALVFNLYCIDGFSHAEIADMLGIEPSLSRQRLLRGREWLRKRCLNEVDHLLDSSWN
jgi:RNA polymerase sigma factor (sigma-70 family)